MTNTAELKKIIDESGIKKKHIAQRLGLSYYGLQLKIEGKNEFKQKEITVLCDILNIDSLKQKDRIFFTQEVDEKSTAKS